MVVATLSSGVAALALYLALGQEVFYKIDGPHLALSLADGHIEHPYNVLYMPFLWCVDKLLGPLGLTAYWTAVAFSALGTAAGVALFHLGLRRLRIGAGQAWLATGLVALCPPVLFFATVVEHHGPFFAFAGLSFVVMVELVRRPGVVLAVALGLSTHLAYAVHGTGNLLPGLLLPWFLALRLDAGTLRRDLGLVAIAGALHLGLWAGLMDVELPRGGGSRTLAVLYDDGIGRPRGIVHLPAILWQEWLGPFLPLSVSFLVAFRRAELRPEAIAALVGLVPYVLLCLFLIVGEEEFGAYLLPMAFPAARLTAAAVPRSTCAALLVLSAVLAFAAVARHDDPTEARSWADGVREVAGGRRVVMLAGGTPDIAFLLTQMPDAERYLAVDIALAVDPAAAEPFRGFDLILEARRGTAILLTEGGRAELEEHPAGVELIAHMHARQVQAGAFRGWLIE